MDCCSSSAFKRVGGGVVDRGTGAQGERGGGAAQGVANLQGLLAQVRGTPQRGPCAS